MSALYADYEAMLEAEDFDTVSVCTPSYLHHDHVLTVARSAATPDIVWCEKPISSSVADAEEMVTVCDERNIELVVNHSFRLTDKLRTVRRLVHEESLLGEVHSVTAQFRMELLRNATHLLDMLVYLLDARADRVAGHITGENETVDSLGADVKVSDAGGGGFVVMDDETFATIDCTVPRADSSTTLQFVGSGGKLYMNNDDGERRYWSLEGKRSRRVQPAERRGVWTWDDYRSAFLNAARHVEASSTATGRTARPARGDALARNHHRLIPVLLYRRHLVQTAAEVRRNLVVVAASDGIVRHTDGWKSLRGLCVWNQETAKRSRDIQW